MFAKMHLNLKYQQLHQGYIQLAIYKPNDNHKSKICNRCTTKEKGVQIQYKRYWSNFKGKEQKEIEKQPENN